MQGEGEKNKKTLNKKKELIEANEYCGRENPSCDRNSQEIPQDLL